MGQQVFKIGKMLENILERELTDSGRLTLVIRGNHVTYTLQEDRSEGSEHYSGAYHPGGSCYGRGICLYCGRTLFD
jgi:hypothetical protein